MIAMKPGGDGLQVASDHVLERTHQEEAFVKTLLEAIPIPVFYKDRQGRYLGFNKAFEDFFRVSRQGLIGKSVFETNPPDLAEVYHAKDNELFESGGVQVYESQVRNVENVLRDVIFNKAVFTDSQGRAIGLIGIVLDVTNRKKAEKALRASEESYRSIFENTGAATIIVENDTTISLANREFENLSGFSKIELENRMSWMDFVAFDSELQQMQAYHRQRRVDPDSVPKRYEFLFQDRYKRQKNISLTIDLIPGTDKSVASLLDITELKRTQEALHEREQKYRLLAENTADIIWSADADLKMTYVSPSVERILGYSQEEVYRSSLESMCTPATYQMLLDKYRKVKAGRIAGTMTLELEQVRRDGSRITTEVSITPLFDSRNAFIGAQGVTRDITSRKKAEHLRARQQKRLRQLAVKLASAQDQEQRRLAEGLHDDVSQLLTACSVKLNVARGSQDSGEVERTLDEVDALLRESNEKVRLLSFELGSSTLYRLGLRAAVKELCEGMSRRYNARFTVLDDGDPQDIDQSSAIALFKSVRELLFNVVKHTCAKEATVSICREGTMLKLAVEDRGIGFPRSFGDGDQEADNGLGLFGIQERLRDLGGRMRIDSEPNVLTRVTLWAPL
jgi:PAS domain S-box-containing protein